MSARQPAAPPGRLHLLLAAQAPLAARAQAGAQEAWLTASEQTRLAGMQHPARRQEFIACRWALRELLATGGHVAASDWRLDAPEGRAPHLNAGHHGAQAAGATHLSLTHSGAWLACAAAPHPVGIDLEVKDLHASQRDVLALAAMACTPGETAQLQALADGPERQHHFLQIWSLKEAYFKCMGTGVDFAAIRRIECRRAEASAAIPQALASARSWRGSTPQGADVVLSACLLGAGGLPPCEPLAGEDVVWHGRDDWVLLALPE